jgi:hypothetical protein
MHVTHKGAGGYVCVLNAGKPGAYCDNYITSEFIPDSGGMVRIEVVISGHVRLRRTEPAECGPRLVIDLARRYGFR